MEGGIEAERGAVGVGMGVGAGGGVGANALRTVCEPPAMDRSCD